MKVFPAVMCRNGTDQSEKTGFPIFSQRTGGGGRLVQQPLPLAYKRGSAIAPSCRLL